MNKNPLWEAVKHALRLALIGFFSIVISELIKAISGLPPTNTTIILTFLLSSFDKWYHISRKQTRDYPEGKALGFIPY